MNKIKFLVLILLSTCLLLSVQIPVALGEQNACDLSEQALESAIEIRGLKKKNRVVCLVNNQEQVKQYLIDAIDSKVPPEKLVREELIYKTLGFLPAEFSYKDGLIDLYVSQLGGYYDPEQKHFVMAGWMPAMLQVPIAVHELTHALQDQHFNLDTFLDHDNHTTDQLLARSALVEGDATAVMIDYTRGQIGQGSLRDEENVDMILFQNVLGASMNQEFAKAPQSLQAILLFPYNSGLRFAHHIIKKQGYAGLDKIFKKPPQSTREILHPEYFLDGSFTNQSVQSEELLTFFDAGDKPAGDSLVYEDTLGEFFVSATLKQCGVESSRSAKIATGWLGDRLGLFSESDQTIIWKTSWDNSSTRDNFFKHYQHCFKGDKANAQSTESTQSWQRGGVTLLLKKEGEKGVVLIATGLASQK